MRIGESYMHLASGVSYTLDDFVSKKNNNVLIVGASGTSKTRSIVIPNILQATGSYVISDPKGVLYDGYSQYLRDNGYNTYLLDFKNLKNSISYNPFDYIKCEYDVLKVANILISQTSKSEDPYWTNSGKELLAGVIAYVKYDMPKEYHNLSTVVQVLSTGTALNVPNTDLLRNYLLDSAKRNNSVSPEKLNLEYFRFLYEDGKYTNVDLYAWAKFLNNNNHSTLASRLLMQCANLTADTTKSCIVAEAMSPLGIFNYDNTQHFINHSTFNFLELGYRKTALFISCSDTDRSLDSIVSLVWTQLLQVLCDMADKKCPNYRLPIPVRLILDDFATNFKIADFDKAIAMIRSRGISATIIIQDYNQLKKCYDDASKTISSNCDTWVYLGGNDYDTINSMANQMNTTTRELMLLKNGECYIYRRGEESHKEKLIDLDLFNDSLKLSTNDINVRSKENDDAKALTFGFSA